MTLLTSLVEVRTITCDRSRSEFDEQQIEEAARSIVAAEGIINPIILTRTGINFFAVINGHFEYHAAARAKEIDLAIGETVSAYIVDEENDAIAKQIDILRKPQPNSDKATNYTDDSVSKTSNSLETRLNNLESRIDNRLKEIKQEYKQENQDLAEKIQVLQNKLPEKIEPLTTLNEANKTELITKLKPILKSDKKTTDITNKIIKGRPFASLSEVLAKTKGLGEKTMLRIIDRWLYSE